MARRRRTPKQVKIGYATYKISPRSAKWGIKNKAVGQIETLNGKILYDRSQSDDELPNTILHEILHGINYVFDIKYDNARQEEKIVRAVANGLCTLFVDNPDLLEWIKYRIEKKKKDDAKT